MAAIAAGAALAVARDVRSGSSPAGCRAGGSAYLALATVSPSCRCSGARRAREPARPDAPGGARARRAARSPRVRCCGSSRTPRGRSAGCAGRPRSAGPRSCARSPAPGRPCCCSRARHGVLLLARGAARRRRDIGERPAPRPRQRPAAPAPALLPGGAGPAQPARQPDRLAARASASSRSSSASSRQLLLGDSPQNAPAQLEKLGAGVDRHALRLPHLRLPLLRPRPQPVHLRPDRRRAREEAEQQLETLLALPVSRAAGSAAGCCSRPRPPRRSRWRPASAWAGAAAQGAGIALAGARGRAQLPSGRAALPRVSAPRLRRSPRGPAPVAYGLVDVAFLWQLLGALLERAGGARPHAVPPRRAGARPAVPRRGAAVMLAIGAAAARGGTRSSGGATSPAADVPNQSSSGR